MKGVSRKTLPLEGDHVRGISPLKRGRRFLRKNIYIILYIIFLIGVILGYSPF